MFGSGRGGRCWREWVIVLGLGFTNSGATWGNGTCVCVLVVVVWEVLGRVAGRLGPGFGRVEWCYVCTVDCRLWQV